MLRPTNLFNAKQPLKSVNLKEQIETKVTKETQQQDNSINDKIEKLANEITSFIKNSENAYDSHKKELTDTINKYISEFSEKTNEITKKVESIDQNFLSIKREPIKSVNLIKEDNNDNEKTKNTETIKPEKKTDKQTPKRYYKLTNDLIDKVKNDYPSLDKKHFDNLYVRDEKVFIKVGMKYVELNTDSYCKYSIK